MAHPRKRILCIEDDRESAARIAAALADRGFEIGVAHDGQDGLLAILKDKPDLVLCDVAVPRMSGFEVLECLNDIAPRLGRIPFVFLTALSDRDNELKGRQLGADDYVTKPIDFDVLETIIAARLAGVARTGLWPKPVDLNDREVEVLRLIACGLANKQIAHTLNIAESTVKNHVRSILSKLGVQDRTQAAMTAVQRGIVQI